MVVGYFERRSLSENLTQTNIMHANCWVHVNGKLADTDISDLADGFSLNTNIIRDAADVHELPRVELSGGVEYI